MVIFGIAVPVRLLLLILQIAAANSIFSDHGVSASVTSNTTLSWKPESRPENGVGAAGYGDNNTMSAVSLITRRPLPRRSYNLFHRGDDLCFTDDTGAVTAACAIGYQCCTNTASTSGWCCDNSATCDVSNFSCGESTVVFTSTSTITSWDTEYSTEYDITFASGTHTETSTRTVVVTASDVATATVVDTTAIESLPGNRARGIASTDNVHRHQPSSILWPTILSGERTIQESIPHTAVTSFVAVSLGTIKRRAVGQTSIVYVTVTSTTTSVISFLSSSTDYDTTTVTVEITTTSALNAGTTVHVTSTIDLPSLASNLSQNSKTDDSDDGPSLSVGAMAGISLGALALLLLPIIVIAVMVLRNKKHKKTQSPPAFTEVHSHHHAAPMPTNNNSQTRDKLVPAPDYSPVSRPMSYQHDYQAVYVPGDAQQSIEVERQSRTPRGRALGSRRPPTELSAL